MAQHAFDSCTESNGLWLPLTEYSVRSGVSTSTIRRKIKSNAIKHRVENGRYLIFFEPDGKVAETTVAIETPIEPVVEKTPTLRRTPVAATAAPRTVQTGESSVALPMMEKAVQMVSEAFEHSLYEKDARIQLLEEQNESLTERLEELKTLVTVLEEKYDVRY